MCSNSIDEAASSSGKAAELLGVPRLDFIRHASGLGIPLFEMTPDEWEAEKGSSRRMAAVVGEVWQIARWAYEDSETSSGEDCNELTFMIEKPMTCPSSSIFSMT